MKRKLLRYSLVVVVCSVLAICGMAYILIHAYGEVSFLVKEQFTDQQRLITKQTAGHIEENIKLLVRELEVLSQNPSIMDIKLSGTREIMESTYDYVRSLYVDDISRTDENGIARIPLHSPNLVGKDFSWRGYFQQVKAMESPAPAYEFITFRGRNEGTKGIIIARPVYHKNGNFSGAILFVIQVREMLAGIIPVQSAPNAKTWVIDENGTVLFHPEYNPGANIHELPGMSESFKGFVDSVVPGHIITGRFVSSDGEEVIATSYPVTIGDATWTLVMQTPETVFTGTLVNFNREYLFGVILALITVMGSSSVIIYLVFRWNNELKREMDEREQAEKLRMESEERFSQLVEYSPLPMAVVDREESIVYLNNKFKRTFGYDIEDVPTVEAWFSAAYPDGEYRRKMKSKWGKYIQKAKEGRWEFRPSEYRVTCKDGAELSMEMYGASIGDKEFIIYSDITERKKLEEQLFHAQKMQAIGTLTGGVAHEFNNIMTAIKGFSELLYDGLAPDDSSRFYVDMIRSSTDRAVSLTQSMLAYSRKQAMNLEGTDLNLIMDSVKDFLETLMPEGIELVMGTTGQPLPIMADRAQIEQVLLNLATNAFDAMSGRGRLTIQAGELRLKDEKISGPYTVPPGHYAVASVSDTGAGIEKSIQGSIFEPFFTTKDIGRGTGLGLAVVYGIINKHNGFVDIESEPGQGATFNLYLPLEAHKETKPATSEERKYQGRGETILLAEDDAMVRELMISSLEGGGYKVMSAADGMVAVKLFKDYQAEIRLLLFDLAMPHLGGKEAYDKISETSPDIDVIFMSGYLSEDNANLLLSEGHIFLAKPISPSELLRQIHVVLNS